MSAEVRDGASGHAEREKQEAQTCEPWYGLRSGYRIEANLAAEGRRGILAMLLKAGPE